MAWYNPQKLLSHNALMSYVIGVRGGGKTFSGKNLGLNRFLKAGKQFIYLRRTEAELDEAKPTFFTQLQSEGLYREYKGKTKGRELILSTKFEDGDDGEDITAGYALALSTAGKFRSVSYPFVDLIIYDEFLVDEKDPNSRYLKREPELFLNFVETVFRMRKGRVLMLGNSFSINNPIFNYFGIRPRYGSKFTTFKDDEGTPLHCIEQWADPEYIAEKYKTDFGRLNRGSDVGNFMYENQFLNDNYEFIENMSGSAIYQCTLHFEGKSYGVYWQEAKGIFHINKNVDKKVRTAFAFTTEDHKPNLLLFKDVKRNPYIKRLMFAYDHGRIRFDSINTRNSFYTLISYI